VIERLPYGDFIARYDRPARFSTSIRLIGAARTTTARFIDSHRKTILMLTNATVKAAQPGARPYKLHDRRPAPARPADRLEDLPDEVPAPARSSC
jgi:hypothetical protein